MADLPLHTKQRKKSEEGDRREEKMGKKLDKLVFALNGEKYEVSPVDPSLTLLEFIRTQTCFKGTKLGCGEGN
jgi:xanthine dehydrogenase iron-sulfur cluster and FAD-binding subunit A